MPIVVEGCRPLDHTKQFEISSGDPAVDGLVAEIGSTVVHRVTGSIWIKFGALATEWRLFRQNGVSTIANWNQQGSPYIFLNNTTPTVMSHWLWEGSNTAGGVSSIKAAARLASAGAGTIQIYDVTNNNQIALKNDITNTGAFTVQDLGTVTNVSATQALWEIRINKNSGGSGRIEVATLSVNTL